VFSYFYLKFTPVMMHMWTQILTTSLSKLDLSFVPSNNPGDMRQIYLLLIWSTLLSQTSKKTELRTTLPTAAIGNVLACNSRRKKIDYFDSLFFLSVTKRLFITVHTYAWQAILFYLSPFLPTDLRSLFCS